METVKITEFLVPTGCFFIHADKTYLAAQRFSNNFRRMNSDYSYSEFCPLTSMQTTLKCLKSQT